MSAWQIYPSGAAGSIGNCEYRVRRRRISPERALNVKTVRPTIAVPCSCGYRRARIGAGVGESCDYGNVTSVTRNGATLTLIGS